MISRDFKKLILLILMVIAFDSKAMLRALNTAATGMSAQEANVNTISNNIANVNTVGYKKQRTEFEDLLYETVTEAGGRSSANTMYNVGVQIGTGAKVSATRRQFSQGGPKITNNPFDFMIDGEGLFGILLPDGSVKYTRDGSFNIDAQGVLVNRNGYPVAPNLSFPPGTASVNVSADGKVEAFMKNQTEPLIVGTIPVFLFTNFAGLKAVSGNLYRATNSSGQPIQSIAGQRNAGTLQQGALETSNVSIMNEMTDLIKAQRAYEMNSKVMGVADQMLQTVNNIR